MQLCLKKLILTDKEYEQLTSALNQIIDLANQGLFKIEKTDEDVHTAVEKFLTKELGDVGKKIHTARSRNDQVSLDLRLYMRDQLLMVMNESLIFVELLDFAQMHRDVPMPKQHNYRQQCHDSWDFLREHL